ncbi:MAG TPA: MDR family MFS transporter [Acidimicrobiales bacterium]|nr:MDR family MFS transporter [Acidimicrobiales bacterium]
MTDDQGGAETVLGAPAGDDLHSMAAVDEAPLTHRQVLTVFSGLMLGLFLAALDQSVVATALPTIAGDFHGLNRLTWVVTAYLLTSTASAPLYGKISDLWGRKKIFQFSIVLFLAASALAGLSQNMNELIIFRGLQGLGAGGLMVLAMSIIGDVVPPLERGRYQGYFGAVFGVSSVAGPLIGGFLVQSISWRWIFYINLPIGAAALAVTTVVLKDRSVRRAHKIDYLGALILVAGVSALLLVTTLGGSPGGYGYPWGSWQIITMIAAGVLLVGLFVLREMKAAEPIVPMYLFRKRVFTASNAAGFIIGLAMFGAIIYLPVYLQVVKGVTPTVSGLELLPLMVGLLGSSILSGQLISRRGRYKIFPVLGTAVTTAGMALLSLLSPTSSDLEISALIFILGVGIGLVMQVLVLAVQNGVDYKDLGTATSLGSFFRSMGGAFGTAILGAVLTDRLTGNLLRALPAPARPHIKQISQLIVGSPKDLKLLPATIHTAAVQAYVHSIDTVFIVAAPITFLAFVFALFLPEIKLRSTVGTRTRQAPAEPGENAAEPLVL